MWLPGHIAIGILLCVPALFIFARGGRSYVVPLAYLAFFAVLPDFFHYEDIRAFSHSLLGAAILVVVGLSALRLVHRWEPVLGVIAAIALGSHLLADVYIGHINPWWPWSMEMVQNNGFNTLFDIRTELQLSALACVPLAFLVLLNPRGVRTAGLDRKDLLAVVALMGLFFLFSVAQTLYFMILDIFQDRTVSTELLLLAFLAALLCSVIVLAGALRRLWRTGNIPERNRFSAL